MWRVIATDREGRELTRKELDVGELTLGRDADRQLVLQSPSVSRRHCRVRADQTGLYITDEGSANGVLVNGTRIAANTPTPINASARVEIAEFRLIIEQIGAPAMAPPMQPMGMPGMMQQAPPMQPMGMPGQMPGMMQQAPMGMPGQMPGQMPGMMQQQAPMGMPGMMQPPAPMMPPAGMSGVMPGSAPMQGMGMPGAPADMVRLIAEGGQYNGRVFDLPPLNEISVGRGVGNDLVLDDPSMSRKHSKLRRIGSGRLEVEDLNSANGTYINGRKIATAQAGPGDTIRFGEVMFRLDGAGGGGARQMSADPGSMGLSMTPSWAKGAFFGLAAAAALVWILWLVRLAVPSGPKPGEIEAALRAEKIDKATGHVRLAQEAYNKREWSKAKDEAETALELHPASTEASSLRAQAIRSVDDETKYRQSMTELDKGNPDGFKAAIRIYDSMSPDGSYRQELADKLRNKLMSAGEEFYNKKMYRESFESLCDAHRVSPSNNKPGAKILKMLHDAERRAKVTVPCPLK